jgi:hypothetical protein
MTDQEFYPAMTTWHVMPALMGPSRKVLWLCTDDLGAIAASVFARPDDFIGRDLQLVSDEQSIEECRSIYRSVKGKNPPRIPMPAGVFARFGFVGRDLTTMWRWLRTATLEVDYETTRSIHPAARGVEAWLRQHKG